MPHLAGNCDCGRAIHLPSGAKAGHKWTCHRCGKTWRLSNHGKPLHQQRSLPPRPSPSSDSGSGVGCLIIAAMAALFFLGSCAVVAPVLSPKCLHPSTPAEFAAQH
jgi:hypothetical protein